LIEKKETKVQQKEPQLSHGRRGEEGGRLLISKRKETKSPQHRKETKSPNYKQQYRK
jgi:hypothetical protein